MQALDKSQLIGVVGAGAMGAGIAQVAAKFGHQVRLFDQSANIVEQSLLNIRSGLTKLVERGKLSADEVDELVHRIQPCDDLTQFQGCGLVIEAVVESLSVKQSILKTLEGICGDKTILATNTSSISITAIGSVLSRPENLAGMHFFNPAPIMKLVEVVSGLLTGDHTAQTVAQTAKAWGKKVVFSRSTPGFIVNRIARPFYAESLRLLEEGCAGHEQLDHIIRDTGGFRMGPFELMDLIGLDVNYAVTQSVFNDYFQDSRFLPSLIQRELVDGGLLGRKSGRGFYTYGGSSGQSGNSSSRNASETPVVLEDTECHKSDDMSVSVCESLVNNEHPSQPKMLDQFMALIRAKGLTMTQVAPSKPEQTQMGFITLTQGEINCHIALTDGRTATQRADDCGVDNLVLFDLVNDFSACPSIAVTRSMQTSDQAYRVASEFFGLVDLDTILIKDAPGMCLMRTVCMLANEGADACYQGVCDVTAVDDAMRYGLNYPKGPMQWADEIGVLWVCKVLLNLQRSYGLDRYRTSLLLQQHAHSHSPLIPNS